MYSSASIANSGSSSSDAEDSCTDSSDSDSSSSSSSSEEEPLPKVAKLEDEDMKEDAENNLFAEELCVEGAECAKVMMVEDEAGAAT